ncbi:PEP-CTERM sorting domain-containing protein [Verrucomicrobiota bacterium sgz303538]
MQTRHPILRTIITAAITGAAHMASAGIMSYAPMSGDADSGINSALSYTAKADFFGTGAHVVNGVSFLDTGFTGTGYSLSGPSATLAGGNPNLVTGEVGGMVNDFTYGPADGNATLTLTGLTIGTEYVTTWYNRGWGSAGGRYVFITASDTPDGVFRIDQNFTGDGNGNVIRYTFIATATTQTYAFDAVNNGDSFHHYAVSNAVRNDTVVPITSAPVAPRISSLNGSGPQTPAGVSNTDLLQTHLGSASVNGTVDAEGTGGVAALYDGTFTAGAGNGAYFTPEAGASVTFNLDVTTNTSGYDISSVRGYGGWNDNGRDRQNYSIYYSLVGDSNFLFLGTVDFDTGIAGGLTSTVTSIFDTALTGVDAIRVDFLAPQENGHAGYGEFDVIGVASVPEPSSFLLLLSAAPFFLRRRRA